MNQQIKTVYLSGPMTGYKDYNYPAFNSLEQAIKQHNPEITVINPTQTGVQPDWEWNDYLRHDLLLLLEGKPDVIVTLDRWESSRGAKLEVHVAKELGIRVLSDKYFLSLLRGNIFKRPTVIYRKHDYSIYAHREYEDAVQLVEHLKFEHEQDGDTREFPLAIIELPIDLQVEGLIPESTEPKIDLADWIKQQVECQVGNTK